MVCWSWVIVVRCTYKVVGQPQFVWFHCCLIMSGCSSCQVSQYTFAMCSYRERKADPTEIVQLDGFTVDYCEPIEGINRDIYMQSRKFKVNYDDDVRYL
jgi:hypothetical protein